MSNGMNTEHLVIIGDSRNMKELKDNSVHQIITSPPYWQLKDYGNSNQIGFHDTYEQYINNLSLVWKECYRVLHSGCKLCINIGDQFARSVYYGRYKVIPIRTEIIKFCETIGFDYMGAIIWQKVTTCNTTGGASIMGSYPYPRNGIIKIDYEFILIFKKLGDPPKALKAIKEKSKLTEEEWNTYFYGHWNFSGEKQDKHLAMFPEELPKRLIKMYSFVGDTVLDPFFGSGTTSLAAIKLNRNSVGYEINEKILPVIKEKLKPAIKNPFSKAEIEFKKQEEVITNFQDEIKSLPYIFRDPQKFDKKLDPRKLNFGSKIDENSKNGQKYLSVKEILSPEKLILGNDLKIKLLGIKENEKLRDKAISFLNELTNGHKVFLKFDKIKYDNKGDLLCYLYLKNKTFVNAHLLKSGLVEPDITLEYKYKSRFLSFSNSKST